MTHYMRHYDTLYTSLALMAHYDTSAGHQSLPVVEAAEQVAVVDPHNDRQHVAAVEGEVAVVGRQAVVQGLHVPGGGRIFFRNIL